MLIYSNNTWQINWHASLIMGFHLKIINEKKYKINQLLLVSFLFSVVLRSPGYFPLTSELLLVVAFGGFSSFWAGVYTQYFL